MSLPTSRRSNWSQSESGLLQHQSLGWIRSSSSKVREGSECTARPDPSPRSGGICLSESWRWLLLFYEETSRHESARNWSIPEPFVLPSTSRLAFASQVREQGEEAAAARHECQPYPKSGEIVGAGHEKEGPAPSDSRQQTGGLRQGAEANFRLLNSSIRTVGTGKGKPDGGF